MRAKNVDEIDSKLTFQTSFFYRKGMTEEIEMVEGDLAI